MKNLKLIVLSIALCIGAIACDNEEDYSNIALKNYFFKVLDKANSNVIGKRVGTQEGQYSEEALKDYEGVIYDANQVYYNTEATQADVDKAIDALLAAATTFYDKVVPYTSKLVSAIADGKYSYDNVQEGTADGQVAIGAKAVFQAALDKAQVFIDAGGYTQSMLDVELKELLQAQIDFEKQIKGAFVLPIENASFEQPGYSTIDFNLIPGWKYGGLQPGNAYDSGDAGVVKGGEHWSLPAGTTTAGSFAGYIGNYTYGIWQRLGEGVKPGVNYEISFDASIKSSTASYETFALFRVIVFNGADNDWSNITILHQSSYSLGKMANRNDFVPFNKTFSIPTTGEATNLIGKKIVIFFACYLDNIIQYPSPPSGTPKIWSRSTIFLDKIVLKRKSS